ncbi:acetyltransferase [Massilia cavernae]|uniref:Acetyltransferase n=1 Tax=Massilia cavernae TaxID=2320864 RepID=A0A418Y6J5_9BURK|nr:acetyltransferase [Massilia cavernae]RJG23857.1 acetyltransferase [Massilia cavernae]
MSFPIIVIGAGGHAAVVADALLASGQVVLGFTDASSSRRGQQLCGLPVLGDDAVLAEYDPGTVVLANGLGSVGNEATQVRQRVQQSLEGQGWHFCPVVHPSAVISRFACLGESVQVMAGCVIQAGAAVGAGCIINTASVVEHNAVIDAWSHVAPRAVVCGDVRVGAGSHVGAGATVRHGVSLGARTLVGAGAVVVKDFSGSGVLVGIPARQLER